MRKFYEVWTLKESYIKCYGSGLSMSLKSFSIKIDSYKAVRILSDNGEKVILIQWQFWYRVRIQNGCMFIKWRNF